MPRFRKVRSYFEDHGYETYWKDKINTIFVYRQHNAETPHMHLFRCLLCRIHPVTDRIKVDPGEDIDE
eukprot:768158-Hanusia_phi.AAC.3